MVFHNKGIDAKTGLPTEGGEAWLGGTLTYPKGFKTGMPVILMVTGSGQQNRDEELMGHKPFLVIADYLARHGIATLRYDDRGVGKSTGNMAMITLQSNMLDAEAGIDYLKSTKKFGKIGVLGHSEGRHHQLYACRKRKSRFRGVARRSGIAGRQRAADAEPRPAYSIGDSTRRMWRNMQPH